MSAAKFGRVVHVHPHVRHVFLLGFVRFDQSKQFSELSCTGLVDLVFPVLQRLAPDCQDFREYM